MYTLIDINGADKITHTNNTCQENAVQFPAHKHKPLIGSFILIEAVTFGLFHTQTSDWFLFSYFSSRLQDTHRKHKLQRRPAHKSSSGVSKWSFSVLWRWRVTVILQTGQIIHSPLIYLKEKKYSLNVKRKEVCCCFTDSLCQWNC